MRPDGDIGRARPKAGGRRTAPVSPPAGQSCRASYRLLTWVVAAALAGCTDGAGSLMVDPGRYSSYHCNDLATRWKDLVKREKELRDLMDRADQGGGGTVIGSIAYRPEYESVRSEEILLQRTATEKNCNPTTQYQSDQIIR